MAGKAERDCNVPRRLADFLYGEIWIQQASASLKCLLCRVFSCDVISSVRGQRSASSKSGFSDESGVSERRGGTTRYTHSGLKNTGAQSTNAIVATRVYDAYGMVRSATGTWSGPFGYAGGYGYQEDETGLRLLGHRYYDASTGRFLTRDPIKDGRNWYSYCDGDPINGVDPTGLAKIYLAWRHVLVGGNHCYLIIVDEKTGQTWTVGGGPEGNWPNQLLVDKSGPAGPKNYEGINTGGKIPENAFLLRDDDRSGMFWYRRLSSIGLEIEMEKWKYGTTLTNSNSFIYSIMQRAGLLDDYAQTYPKPLFISSSAETLVPGGAIWAPGWSTKLPRPK